jgi:tripartite ATP-independent transporter DctP family solute receptor
LNPPKGATMSAYHRPRRPGISRGRLLAVGASAGAFASIGFLRYPGSAAEFSYKLANDQTTTHPMTAETIAAAKRVQDASGGQLEIRIFPQSVLGGDPQMLAQARSGALEFLEIGNNILGNVVPVAALTSIPFAFGSFKQFMGAVNGPMGEYLATAISKIDLRSVAAFYGGAFQMQNRLGPVNSPADLKGVKMRVPPGPIDVATFKAFDASPTVLSLADVYTALQTHIVDAIEIPLPTFENFKYYELVKFCSITSHSRLIYFLVANNVAWARLPTKLQDIVSREFGVAASAGSTGMNETENSLETTLRSQGVAINHPASDAFRKAIRDAGLYKTWRDQYDPEAWKLLEKATGQLT